MNVQTIVFDMKPGSADVSGLVGNHPFIPERDRCPGVFADGCGAGWVEAGWDTAGVGGGAGTGLGRKADGSSRLRERRVGIRATPSTAPPPEVQPSADPLLRPPTVSVWLGALATGTPFPVEVHFPFTGLWLVQNSPVRRIPSHGSELFGETYAIDFVGVDESHRSSSIRDWRTAFTKEPRTALSDSVDRS